MVPLADSGTQSTRLVVVGLLGGIASGKSAVAGCFEALGAERIDADVLAHVALARPDLRRRVVGTFGPQVVGENGQIERARLAQVVFADGARLRTLEEILHPAVGDAIRERLAQLERRRRAATVVLDVPKLLEAGLEPICTALVFVAAPYRARVARAASRGWTAADMKAREKFQVSLRAKRAAADYVVENDESLAALRAQVERIWRRLHRRATGPGAGRTPRRARPTRKTASRSR